jgi:acylphosphatase
MVANAVSDNGRASPGRDAMTRVNLLRIAGRVQGVGFRLYMQREARSRGITGWVRNRADGTVEAVVQGTPDAVEAMIAWARRGPPSAAVSDVKVGEASGEYQDFVTLPTA